MLCRRKVPKSQFRDATNNEVTYESFVECRQCLHKHHEICVLYHKDVHSEFICSACRKDRHKRLENKYTAESMLSCLFSMSQTT